MVFGLFKRKDPVCGMKEEKGRGVSDNETGKWFCSENCRKEYLAALKKGQKKQESCGCCSR